MPMPPVTVSTAIRAATAASDRARREEDRPPVDPIRGDASDEAADQGREQRGEAHQPRDTTTHVQAHRPAPRAAPRASRGRTAASIGAVLAKIVPMNSSGRNSM